ncbi:MAG: hydrogenase expression/formation protein [Aquificae bacterium]|nr:hydrogenase expression/formation protein [Aquificota bacterium]
MNALPILREILIALKELYEKGEEHIIYINKLPLTQKDRELILDVLGRGQVRIYYSSKTQPAEWWETGIYGVWVGVIKDRDGKPILETVEITYFPKLASAQREDIRESIKYLERRLSEIEEVR